MIHVMLAVMINALLVLGTIFGIGYVSAGLVNGTSSVGFQGSPENGVPHIYLNITEIDFQGGSNTTDSTYLSSPVTFDLLSLVNVTRMLGDVSISPGHYTMVRFVVSNAVAMINGQNVTLKVPSGEVKVPIQFNIVHGQITSIVLTISPDDTQIVQNHILRPVVTGQVDGPG
jgi:hypothetical protein